MVLILIQLLYIAQKRPHEKYGTRVAYFHNVESFKLKVLNLKFLNLNPEAMGVAYF